MGGSDRALSPVHLRGPKDMRPSHTTGPKPLPLPSGSDRALSPVHRREMRPSISPSSTDAAVRSAPSVRHNSKHGTNSGNVTGAHSGNVVQAPRRREGRSSVESKQTRGGSKDVQPSKIGRGSA